jgi:hypothetical protein
VNPLQKVATYQRVLNLQNERQALQKTLKIIDLTGRGSAPKWNQAELRKRLENSLDALSMRPAVISDAVGGLDKVLSGAMAKAGFSGGSHANGYTLAVGLTTQAPTRQEGWHWLRGTLTLRLSSADGKVQGNIIWPLKVSATNQSQLKTRMKAAVDKKLKQELKATVLGFATGKQDSDNLSL